MRLIDADVLTAYMEQGNAARRFLISDFVEAIRNAPTVPTDSKPVEYQCVFPRIKNRGELLEADLDDLTDEEKERRARAEAIPEAVVEACWEKYHSLQSEMQKAEGKMDAILDYVNGYNTGGNI